ncbi:hypothetical protein [Streptomyces sp. NPDC058045]|uniref:hypothetical protein n=1 Tax=Streptomyces sp. NPDC058045 TaxID=3346311 RepID=UPI0036E93E1D
MTAPAPAAVRICGVVAGTAPVHTGPCVLRPGHRGRTHQDAHRVQWSVVPAARSPLAVCELDRGESPFGWSET